MKANDVKPWVGIGVPVATVVFTVVTKVIETDTAHKKKKQDPDYKRARMEDEYSKALKARIEAGEAPQGSKKRSRHSAKAAKHVEMALLFATQLEAEKELPLIIALQEEIEELREGKQVAPFLMGARQSQGEGQPRG